MDYLSYWSLLRKPFAFDDGQVFFAGAPQREAIAGLNYFVTNELDTAILVAPPGCGLTCLLRYACTMHGFGDLAAEMVLTEGNQESRSSLYGRLCQALGFQCITRDLRDQIDQAIEATARQQVRVVWLVDRCDRTAAGVARDLVSVHRNLSVVVGTTPDQLARTAAELQCSTRMDLAPLSVQDTGEYVNYCLEHAGGHPEMISDGAIVRLHEVSQGHLSRLAVIAESALSLAASHRMDEVTPAIVEAIEEQSARAA